MLGNAVVPAVAAFAWKELLSTLSDRASSAELDSWARAN